MRCELFTCRARPVSELGMPATYRAPAPRQAHRLVALAAVLVASLVSPAAAAGNMDSFYLSGDAALQGGAITADVEGGGAAWYNPAGLAKLPRLRLDVSVNALALRVGGHPAVEATAPNARVTTLTTPDITLVPAALTLTQRFGKVGVALGLFVPVQSWTYLRTQVTNTAQDGSGSKVGLGIDAYGHDQSYAVGGAFGVRLATNLDFGGSLFFNYRAQVGITATEFSFLDSDGTRTSLLAHSTLDAQQLGVQPVLGLQFRPAPGSRLGLAFRFPAVQLWQHAQTVNISDLAVAGEQGSIDHQSSFDDSTAISASLVSPMRLHLGASHDFAQTLIALEGSYQAPLYVGRAQLDWRPLFNARLGAKRRLSESVAIGGGIHTDLSPVRHARDFGDAKLDFYGVTVALDLGTRYSVIRRGNEALPPGSGLRFGSTFALTYAVGIGDVVQAQFGDGSGGANLNQIQERVFVHEVILYIASSLTE